MKKKHVSVISLLSLALLGFLIFPEPAYAYLDPGSGSYILQLILAGLLAGLFAIKNFWRIICDWFRKLFRSNKTKN